MLQLEANSSINPKPLSRGHVLRSRLLRGILASTLMGGLVTGMAGCAIFGYAAQVVGEGPVKARYPKGGGLGGLSGQSVSVMVWVDRAVRIDYPSLQLDIGNQVRQKLIDAKKADKEELKDASFDVEPRSIVKYQREHPETDAVPILDTAPVFNVSRLIYIEVHDFATRPNAGLELFRGQIFASVKVIEVDEAGKARVGYQEDDVRIVMPKKSPPEGLPGTTDVRIYQAVVNEFTTEMSWRFFEHWEETN